MLTINLLPTKDKEDLKFEFKNHILNILNFWLVLIFLTFFTLTANLYYILKNQLKHYQNINIHNTSEYQEQKNIKQEIISLNKKIIFIHNLKNKTTTPLIEEIISLMPNGAKLINFSIDNDSNNISINGLANTREIVLNIQKNIKDNEKFTEINYPVGNFLKQKNINFQFNFKLIK